MNFALQDNAKFGFIISNFWQKVKNSRVNFIYSSVVDILFIYLETKKKNTQTPQNTKNIVVRFPERTTQSIFCKMRLERLPINCPLNFLNHP